MARQQFSRLHRAQQGARYPAKTYDFTRQGPVPDFVVADIIERDISGTLHQPVTVPGGIGVSDECQFCQDTNSRKVRSSVVAAASRL